MLNVLATSSFYSTVAKANLCAHPDKKTSLFLNEGSEGAEFGAKNNRI